MTDEDIGLDKATTAAMRMVNAAREHAARLVADRIGVASLTARAAWVAYHDAALVMPTCELHVDGSPVWRMRWEQRMPLTLTMTSEWLVMPWEIAT